MERFCCVYIDILGIIIPLFIIRVLSTVYESVLFACEGPGRRFGRLILH